MTQEQEQYEKELAERQRNHLDNISTFGKPDWRPCMHDQCSECHGTGIRKDGGTCVHGISCPCPKCTPTY